MGSEFSKKIIPNFRFDYFLFSAPNINLIEKISLLFNKYLCIISNKRKITYLGSKFYYDHRFSPVILEYYPKEISDVDKVVNLSKIKSALDIGANIGQFSYTLKKLYPKIETYSFEPNKEIFPILEKNSTNLKKLKVYNFGIGKKTGRRTFYFCPTASAEGSFYKENMYQNYKRKGVKKTQVDIIRPTAKVFKKLGIPKYIDLVKIDVEGAEIEVLKSLKEIDFKYLYVEVSIKRRGGGELEEVMKVLKKRCAKPQVIYYNLPDKNAASANVIFLLKSNK